MLPISETQRVQSNSGRYLSYISSCLYQHTKSLFLPTTIALMLAENILTSVYMSSSIKNEFQEKLCLDLTSAWTSLPAAIIICSGTCKLVSISLSRIPSLIENNRREKKPHSYQRHIKPLILAMQSNTSMQPINRIKISTTEKESLNSLFPITILQSITTAQYSGHVDQPKLANCITTTPKITTGLDASFALIPAWAFSTRLLTLLHSTSVTAKNTSGIFSFISKAACGYTYYCYRQDSVSEVYALLNAIIKYGAPPGFNRRKFIAFAVKAAFTAAVDGCTVFFTADHALMFIGIVPAAALALTSSGLYAHTSWCNTMSSHIKDCFEPSSNSIGVNNNGSNLPNNRSCHPLSDLFVGSSIIFGWIFGIMSVMYCMQKMGGIQPSNDCHFEDRVGWLLLASALAYLPTHKAILFTLPKTRTTAHKICSHLFNKPTTSAQDPSSHDLESCAQTSPSLTNIFASPTKTAC